MNIAVALDVAGLVPIKGCVCDDDDDIMIP